MPISNPSIKEADLDIRDLNKDTDSITVYDHLPTSGNNPSIDLSYDGDGNLQYIDETIGTATYRTTLTYSGGVLVGVSEAVEL